MRHKVPRDTDIPDYTCYTRYVHKTAIAYGRLISVSVMSVSGRFFESPSLLGSAPQNGGYRVQCRQGGTSHER